MIVLCLFHGARHTKEPAEAHPVSVDFLRLLFLNGQDAAVRKAVGMAGSMCLTSCPPR